MKSQPNVLLVEGDATEEMLARKVITNSGVNCHLTVARDGVEACDILFNGKPPFDLVLLDLNLPKLDGFEVLTRIRNHDATKRLTVVMLSASGEQADVQRCFDLHADSYVRKDTDLECHETRLKLVLYYWIAVNQNANT